MSEIFKKGQIIPKRIGGVTIHKKARHRIKFGCDVEVNGNQWKAINNNGIAMVNCDNQVYIAHKNGTKQNVDIIFKNINFDCAFIADYVIATK